MTILGWNQPIYICNDFPLFFSVFINIHEYANYVNKVPAHLTMEWKAYVLALF